MSARSPLSDDSGINRDQPERGPFYTGYHVISE